MDQPTTTTEVAVAGQTAMAACQEPFDNGLGELDAGDLIIPRLSITQPTTPDIDAAQVGKFCVNITGDYQDAMRVALIKLSKSRILFPEKYKRDNDPLCRSHDFKFPANDIVGSEPMAKTCQLIPGDKKKHVCEYANWGSDGSAPRCQETWNLLIVDLDSYLVMWFSLKSTALKPLRKIVSAISMISTAKGLPMWGMGFDMKISMETNDSGKFYVPVFSDVKELPKHQYYREFRPEVGWVEGGDMHEIRTRLVNVDIKDAVEPDAPDAPPAQSAPAEEEF